MKVTNEIRSKAMKMMWKEIKKKVKKFGGNYKYSKSVHLQNAWRKILNKMDNGYDSIVDGLGKVDDWFAAKNHMCSGFYEVIKETNKAVFAKDDNGTSLWIPKSVIN